MKYKILKGIASNLNAELINQTFEIGIKTIGTTFIDENLEISTNLNKNKLKDYDSTKLQKLFYNILLS